MVDSRERNRKGEGKEAYGLEEEGVGRLLEVGQPIARHPSRRSPG